MPLFGSGRDASLMRHLNKELINDIVNTEIIFHKISSEDTKVNIYGESLKKTFYAPVRINCLINRQEKETFGDEDFMDFTRTIRFAFLRDTLVELGTYVTEGDILEWDTEFYELSRVFSNQLWVGRNPETLPATVSSGFGEFGYEVSIVAEGFKVDPDRYNLRNLKAGMNREYNLTERI
jgi:hypothetical protein